MVRGEKRKTVVFNLDNPAEAELYEFANRSNFARLVKTLLARELQRIKVQRGATQHNAAPQSENTLGGEAEGAVRPKG